jgi:thiol-disulfide isomerase/thioredoxin
MLKTLNFTILSVTLFALMVISSPLQATDYGDEPINFTLPRLHGEPLSLAELRGNWAVVNYWATWCAPCRKEIPDLSALNSAHEDIIVLGLAFEDTTTEKLDEFLEEFQPSYPLLLVDVYNPPEPFGAPKVLPTTIILNPEGIAVKTFLGPVTREDIEWFIDQQCSLTNC